MSIIHVNQIKNHITRLFADKIDMSDAGKPGTDFDNQLLSRSLAAYAIYYLSGADPIIVAKSITDGGNDNGIDALFYHEPEKRLYIVQAKWKHSGTGEPSNGDMKKFIAGVKDLFNMRLERFNEKIMSNKQMLEQVLNDPQSTYNVVVAYTGINKLSEPSQRDLDDLKDEMNDASELLTITTLNQTSLHASLTARLAGEPIDVEMHLRSWGKVETPYTAYYGQVSGSMIAEMWAKYGDRLFAKNLRSLLGDTDVNTEIRTTLLEKPENFWYYNNGITIISEKITKTMAGGGNTDYGTFHCQNISIVNGAQTVSTIGRQALKTPDFVAKSSVPLRVISLENADDQLELSITKTNNRQNRIDNRDFVTLDPEQNRLKEELLIEGITYHVSRSESFVRTDNSFDLVEGTVALACSANKPHLFVQLKREIGKLWEDISRSPYKELYNPTINSLFLWRIVQTQRFIEAGLTRMMNEDKLAGRDNSIAIHGNRLISAVVFQSISAQKLADINYKFDVNVTEEAILDKVRDVYSRLKNALDLFFANAIIPTLFKNLTKCSTLYSTLTTYN